MYTFNNKKRITDNNKKYKPEKTNTSSYIKIIYFCLSWYYKFAMLPKSTVMLERDPFNVYNINKNEAWAVSKEQKTNIRYKQNEKSFQAKRCQNPGAGGCVVSH